MIPPRPPKRLPHIGPLFDALRRRRHGDAMDGPCACARQGLFAGVEGGPRRGHVVDEEDRSAPQGDGPADLEGARDVGDSRRAIERRLLPRRPGAHEGVWPERGAEVPRVAREPPAQKRRLVEAAAAKGLRLGSAPDTFLGGAHQTARRAIDEGLIGRPIGGAAFFMCPGHERWHPNPGFYYLAGGGPMLDMGPYYVTDLVNLLGPVASVSGVATRTRSERIVTSQPLAGTRAPVEVATHVTGTLMFGSGAAVSMTMSFDVARHRHGPIELYGETGSLIVPDPNHFGGKVEFATASEDWLEIPTQGPYADGNYRIVGLADMAQAIRSGRPHRASGELAFHVLEVMEAFQTSSDAGKSVAISSRPQRPAPLPSSLRVGELD